MARFPLLVRECGGITPTLTGRLGFGREVTVDLNGKSGRPGDQLACPQSLVRY